MKKNKFKPRKSVIKRYKVTKKGKLLHRGHGNRHLKSNKSKKRIRRLNKLKQIKGTHKLKIKKMIGV